MEVLENTIVIDGDGAPNTNLIDCMNLEIRCDDRIGNARQDEGLNAEHTGQDTDTKRYGPWNCTRVRSESNHLIRNEKKRDEPRRPLERVHSSLRYRGGGGTYLKVD